MYVQHVQTTLIRPPYNTTMTCFDHYYLIQHGSDHMIIQEHEYNVKQRCQGISVPKLRVTALSHYHLIKKTVKSVKVMQQPYLQMHISAHDVYIMECLN